MKIAVLSGKGGTGKTLVSVNLAAAAGKASYLDCDVEEPNGHLFFKPEGIETRQVKVPVPRVDKELCDGCRKCVDCCTFNALAHTGKELMILDRICHSCGGCVLVCPQKALSEEYRVIGRVERGLWQDVEVHTGILNTGEAISTPILEDLMNQVRGLDGIVIIDAPPGSACNVMESIKEADYLLLVAEPSIFGLHNLEMVHELAQVFDKPFGVVLNKVTEQFNPSEQYCLDKKLRILAKIPFDFELGEISSNGGIAYNESPRFRLLFGDLLKEVLDEAAANS
ncbi:MAG: ATPase [Tissierellia bacterium]|nr:ATPase [Tissierellia bacterium]